MSELRTDANTCFVCGPGNPDGLQLVFRLEDDLCRSEFTPGPNHCGYDGVTHGGLIFSALDDVMANWIFLKGIRAYTAKCEIRYKAPLPTGTPVSLIGECLKQKGRLVQMKGLMIRSDDGTSVAETEASFMIDR
ncbi:MAG: acyl-coenzyme A thioesterase PaaI-like protein [Candidatus Azotimanducaceae bacterium]|jgi:acyl-coenzyme A thioesterase PaaI-like protein